MKNRRYLICIGFACLALGGAQAKDASIGTDFPMVRKPEPFKSGSAEPYWRGSDPAKREPSGAFAWLGLNAPLINTAARIVWINDNCPQKLPSEQVTRAKTVLLKIQGHERASDAVAFSVDGAEDFYKSRENACNAFFEGITQSEPL